MERDQLDYNRSIGDSWKNQMLANLVKLRYVDMPVFIEVGQIVAGYTLETEVSGNVGFGNSFTGGDAQSFGASGKYTDRPTITYTPKTGDAYLASLLEPVKPSSLLSLVLAGYNPKLLFTWAVQSINGRKNYSSHNNGKIQAADPEFIEFVDLLVDMQREGAIGFEIIKDEKSGHEVIFRFLNNGLSEESRAKARRAGEIIGLKEDVETYRIIYSPYPVSGNILAMQTRSVMQMLIAMSGFIDVPADKSQRATPGFSLPAGFNKPFQVYSGPKVPDDVFASYKYHGDWYWIEHNDIESKRVFTLMLFVTTLTSHTGQTIAPVLTIPTG
jgi:hypothetical protein